MGLEFEDGDIAAYQLSSKVLEQLNITDGVINKCHQSFKDQKEQLTNLRALEYDVLYGQKFVYDGKNPYLASDMKINCRKISITDVALSKEDSENILLQEVDFHQKALFV
mgnify:CR=1 FL=1